jgi:hypothetical protein
LDVTEVERDEVTARLGDASGALEEAKAEAAKLDVEVQHLSDEFRAAHAKCKENEGMLEEMADENEQLLARLEATQGEMELRVQEAKHCAEGEARELAYKYDTASAEKDALVEELRLARDEVADLQARMGILDEALVTSQQCNTSHQANKIASDRKLTEVSNQLQSLTDHLESARSTITILEAKLRAKEGDPKADEVAAAPATPAVASGNVEVDGDDDDDDCGGNGADDDNKEVDDDGKSSATSMLCEVFEAMNLDDDDEAGGGGGGGGSGGFGGTCAASSGPEDLSSLLGGGGTAGQQQQHHHHQHRQQQQLQQRGGLTSAAGRLEGGIGSGIGSLANRGVGVTSSMLPSYGRGASASSPGGKGASSSGAGAGLGGLGGSAHAPPAVGAAAASAVEIFGGGSKNGKTKS